MQERRNSSRKRSFLKGVVYYNNHLSSAECLIRDLSEHGARVQFGSVIGLPDTVELHIPARDQIIICQVRWRKGDEVGLAFQAQATSTGEAVGPVGDINTRVAALEDEVTRLHRQIAELRREMKRLRGED
ncbi:MAG: PilZ domain-containing protein [Bradyrhizobiaceae bacterium]|nr:PilZ domain-containing protein [Bradyrhizobiaceae bacterium]